MRRQQMFTIQPAEKLLGVREDDLGIWNRTQFENQVGVIVPVVCNLAPLQVPEVKRHGIPSASPFGSKGWNSLSFLDVAALPLKARKLCWALSGAQLHNPTAHSEEQK